MCKKEHKSFKEYAQRWRDLAAQVAPPMMEREMITMIVDTLPVFYYEKMVGYTLSYPNFVRGPSVVGMRPSFDHPSLGNSWSSVTSRKSKEGIVAQSVKFRDMPEIEKEVLVRNP